MGKSVPLAWEPWDRLLHGDDPDPLEVIRVAGMYQRYFFEVQDRAVRVARAQGRSWEEIGQAVGTTRQAAWQRYGKFCPAPSPEMLKGWLDPATAPRIIGQTLLPPPPPPSPSGD